jgi:hypothetical protein
VRFHVLIDIASHLKCSGLASSFALKPLLAFKNYALIHIRDEARGD